MSAGGTILCPLERDQTDEVFVSPLGLSQPGGAFGYASRRECRWENGEAPVLERGQIRRWADDRYVECPQGLGEQPWRDQQAAVKIDFCSLLTKFAEGSKK